ncbi:MAG TPA: 16S rRNA (cytidine(1402)-2'-O)-methyltransferase [Pseudogracilibacillus sp.]|nr:16S rRNA (cytidine(1402)-2'-O)-methyltransferase [Pseudogracilibacillus sp.]
MQIQSSYEESDKGKLYIVPTPIGNLDDMTFRAVQTLKNVDLILAEDTRHTQKLLSHFSITTRLLSFHQHNTAARMQDVLERLLEGKDLALVSDAGMPAISDPGYELVKEAILQEVQVITLPGANAVLPALVGSGLPTEEFLFYGFLPRKQKAKTDELVRLSKYPATIILYESPFRVKETLRQIEKHVGNRQVVISREISKIHEQYIRGTCQELVEWVEEHAIKGECCILIEGNMSTEAPIDNIWWESLSIAAHVQTYEATGLTHKEAMKKAATDRQITKRDVYRKIHIESDN